jgi:hypothetical protein
MTPRERAIAGSLVALVLVAQAGLLLWVFSSTGPYMDDFMVFYLMNRMSFAEFMPYSIYGHICLLQKLLQYAAMFASGFSWRVMTAAELVCAWLTLYTGWRLIRAVSARRWFALLGVAMVAVTPMWPSVWSWWSSSTDALMTLPCIFLFFEALWHRAETGRRRWTFAVALWAVLATLNQEREGVLPLTGLLFLFAATPPQGFKDAWRRVLSLWDVWIACGVGLAAAGFVVVRYGMILNQLPGRGSPAAATGVLDVARFVGAHLGLVLFPSVTGTIASTWGAAQWWVAGFAAALWAAMAWLGRGRRLGWAWAFLILSPVVLMVPVAVGRGNVFALALEPRYGLGSLVYLVLFFALLDRALFGAPAEAAPVAERTRRAAQALAIGLTVLGVAGSTLTAARHLAGNDGAALARRLRLTWAAIPTSPDDTLLEAAVPQPILLLPIVESYQWALQTPLLERVRPGLSLNDLKRPRVSRVTADAALETYQRLDLGGAIDVAPGCQPSAKSRDVVIQKKDLPEAQAIVLSPSWATTDVPEWATPFRQLADGTRVRDLPVPAALTANYTLALFPLDATVTAVGFELPEGHVTCVDRLRVWTMRRL